MICLNCTGHYRDFLMGIREGAYTYEQLMDYATNLVEAVEVIYKRSALPEKVNPEVVQDAFKTIVKEKLLTR